jgi:ribosomal-protein-alanine N-acetyltransferase
MNSMNVRRMTLEDIPSVIELDKLSFTLPWPERSFRFELTDNPAARCWVFDVDGKVTGMIVAWLLVDEAHIARILITTRQGIARKLLTYALRYMSKEGAATSFWKCVKAIQPRRMYRTFGYVSLAAGNDIRIPIKTRSRDSKWLGNFKAETLEG